MLGLSLRKMFLYLSELRVNRERYADGLRQMAEHMQVVTATMMTSSESTTGAHDNVALDVLGPATSANLDLVDDANVIKNSRTQGASARISLPR